MTTQNKIEQFLGKYANNPQDGRRAMRLLSRISNVDNDTLEDRLKGNDVHSGINPFLADYYLRVIIFSNMGSF